MADPITVGFDFIDRRVMAAVERVASSDPNPADPFRGLYLSDEAVDRLLGGASPYLDPDGQEAGGGASQRQLQCEQSADEAEETGHRLRLRELAVTFGLLPLDIDLLLVALAADLDPRFEQFFGYLNDDVTRRRPSVAVALALCGEPLTAADGRARLLTGPLITELANAGDPVARGAIETIGRALGVGIANLVNIFNPQVVVIGGGVIAAGELLLAPAREVMLERALSPAKDVVRVEAARHGPEAGMIGAALLARDLAAGVVTGAIEARPVA